MKIYRFICAYLLVGLLSVCVNNLSCVEVMEQGGSIAAELSGKEETEEIEETNEIEEIEEIESREYEELYEYGGNVYQCATISTESNINLDLGEWEVYKVTAYTLSEEECGKGPGHPLYGVTSSGAPAEVGITVAAGCRHEIGTVLEIEGRGLRIVQDRGSRVSNQVIDEYFGDPVKDPDVVKRALEFGVRELRARVVLEGKGDPNDSKKQLDEIQKEIDRLEVKLTLKNGR